MKTGFMYTAKCWSSVPPLPPRSTSGPALNIKHRWLEYYSRIVKYIVHTVVT